MSSDFKSFTDEAGIIARAACKWAAVPSLADCVRTAEQHVTRRVANLKPWHAKPTPERQLEVAEALAGAAYSMISQFVLAKTLKQWPVFE